LRHAAELMLLRQSTSIDRAAVHAAHRARLAPPVPSLRRGRHPEPIHAICRVLRE
jgi:hypothetical protein